MFSGELNGASKICDCQIMAALQSVYLAPLAVCPYIARVELDSSGKVSQSAVIILRSCGFSASTHRIGDSAIRIQFKGALDISKSGIELSEMEPYPSPLRIR